MNSQAIQRFLLQVIKWIINFLFNPENIIFLLFIGEIIATISIIVIIILALYESEKTNNK